jgi:hypothetical protein
MKSTAQESTTMNPVTKKLRTATAILCLAGLALNNAVAQAPAEPNRMFIQILDGEGVSNDIRSRTAREPIVQIEDENHKPIAGAVVIFSTPNSGPSAIFSNGLTSFKTTTGADGRAAAEGLKPNSVTGAFQIQVSATFGTLSSVAVINQTNTGKASSTHARETPIKHGLPIKAIAIVGAIAGGAIVTGLLLSQGSHSDTITPGKPGVGPPQ